MSKVPAHWELAHIPVAMAKGTGVMIFGNGDVESVAEARRKAAETGVDGVMIGRGIFGTPWLFSEREDVTVRERLSIMLEHTKLYWDLYGPTDKNREIFNGYTKSFALMKKHYKAYVKGFDGAGELREKLMAAETAEEVEMVVQSFFSEAPAELLKTVV